VGEAFSLDESISHKQPRLRRLNRGWEAAPTESQRISNQFPLVPAHPKAMPEADEKTAAEFFGRCFVFFGAIWYLNCEAFTEMKRNPPQAGD
jgi:hypothetical protein